MESNIIKDSYNMGGLYFNNITHILNVDKIQTLDDVKRVLKFLRIEAVTSDTICPNGWNEVKDLFK